ncbi:hypothetical protein EAS62_08090 [Bradyrhizobium zhanjiangense]|uniref:Polysaccharide chain length determinant N-terminal domain-containing protein n=2 Tax=Bradyrhizobium zhanjiangense TaxID=1325107 RepID=A0ABY0DPU2_9BRAD|nr:hypothetical protein EAS62_08090 [Bradyrhizobium zhanjiangense]
MPMDERTPQASVFLPLARWSDVAVQAVRTHWVLSLVIGAMLLAALGSLAVGRKVESWTATSTIAIGTMPSLESILGLPGTPIERVESARDLVTRIGAIQFQNNVLVDARKALHDPQGAFAGASVRGVVMDDSSIRLEASSASKEEALTLLQQTILAIQAAHQRLFEPRMELLRSVRASLQDARVRLNDSIKKGDTDFAPARSDGTFAGPVIVASPGASVDRMLNVDTRIALLAYLERTGRMTASQDELSPATDGPRQVNLVRRAILAGLGMVLFISLLTFFLRRSARPV